MIRVNLKVNEPLEKALKRFKKLCDNEGITKTLKRISYYEKPSERRRRKDRETKRNLRKAVARKERAKGKDKKGGPGTFGARGPGGPGGPGRGPSFGGPSHGPSYGGPSYGGPSHGPSSRP